MKGLRDITVVLEESARSEIRLTIAVALAQQHDAHLTGLSALDLLMPTKPFVPRRGNPEVDTQPASQLQNWGVVPPLAIEKWICRWPKRLSRWRLHSGSASDPAVCRALGAWQPTT
jgi:hypothetical protein